MPINPCRECQMMEQDKNNAVCLKCEKRVLYVVSLEVSMRYPFSNAEEAAFSPLRGLTPELFLLHALKRVSPAREMNTTANWIA